MKKSKNSIKQTQPIEIETPNQTENIVKITKDGITITLLFQEKPVMTSILLCIFKPDMGFIFLAYCLVYIFIFYLIMLKCYETYLNTISNMSPKTLERLDYIYSSFELIINTTKSMFSFLYYENNEIKRIEYLP